MFYFYTWRIIGNDLLMRWTSSRKQIRFFDYWSNERSVIFLTISFPDMRDCCYDGNQIVEWSFFYLESRSLWELFALYQHFLTSFPSKPTPTDNNPSLRVSCQSPMATLSTHFRLTSLWYQQVPIGKLSRKFVSFFSFKFFFQFEFIFSSPVLHSQPCRSSRSETRNKPSSNLSNGLSSSQAK